jgi:hypothetical protein
MFQDGQARQDGFQAFKYLTYMCKFFKHLTEWQNEYVQSSCPVFNSWSGYASVTMHLNKQSKLHGFLHHKGNIPTMPLYIFIDSTEHFVTLSQSVTFADVSSNGARLHQGTRNITLFMELLAYWISSIVLYSKE